MNASFFGRYRRLIINLSSAAGLMTLSDLFVQSSFEKKRTIDKTRLVAAFWTGAVMGIEAHIWYTFLDRFIVQTTWGNVIKKVLLDQVICATVQTTTYIAGTSLLEGRTSAVELKDDIESNFGPMYLANCLVYNPAQVINFKYLSASYRVPFVFFVAFLFNIFLSAYKHRNGQMLVYEE